MVDEAHRSNYDFVDGFARHLRDALPNATFIGFTGTPIESDGPLHPAGVRRLHRRLRPDPGGRGRRDRQGLLRVAAGEGRPARRRRSETWTTAFAEATSGTEEEAQERLKTRWARVEAIVGSDKRLTELAADIVAHWEARREVLAGKAMIVAMSRRIAVDLYDEIVALRPDWHTDDDTTRAGSRSSSPARPPTTQRCSRTSAPRRRCGR